MADRIPHRSGAGNHERHVHPADRCTCFAAPYVINALSGRAMTQHCARTRTPPDGTVTGELVTSGFRRAHPPEPLSSVSQPEATEETWVPAPFPRSATRRRAPTLPPAT